ncbi:LOW QUALITY PROTEIN: DExH-box ATP-dependent RNA helicase DExH6-like [Salvia splendens]|uniref:LOW QUALITY PROTEIN: DExH-box ATP-dependent RNA helicase DExH6-like n=1 Tax=Salvia splendens TaxID=180675 RepID=UPI001C26E4F4|nr:LOW QUALITY PROTEIN: DExH-box ATP-dependent RNA helicase DExH6-like [Salvia splendens]
MGPPGSSGKEAGKKRRKGRVPPNNMKVAEATRIRIAEILENFRSSDDEVYKFEENLTNQERAAVHVMCRKVGFMSKSHGKGQDRRICIYKRKREVSSMKGRENIASFRFSGESQAALQELFSCYPPKDVDMSGNKLEVSRGKSDNGVSGDDFFCRPTTNSSEIASKIQTLASRNEKETSLKQITQNRSKLPIASFRDAITSSVESNQVVLVCGETGCGKTTQVPQFLLDHAWSKGETCKVVCTQPRRISATSVAERIASERGESIGDSVGYKIRLETKGGRQSSLVFCTNGVLLRVLVNKDNSSTKRKKASKKGQSSVADITHIIVDEIHERDRFSDFMLAIIRDMLPSHPHLRLVLMSATIDADRFSKYFGGCPVIRVPGFTYPVKSYYLEDVLALVRSSENNHVKCTNEDVAVKDSPLTEECRVALDEAIELASSTDDFDPLLELISSQGDSRIFNYLHSKTGVTPLMVSAEQGRVSYVCTLLSFGVDCDLRCNAGKTALDYAEQGNQGEVTEIIKKHLGKAFTQSDKEQDLLDKYLSHVDPELIDCLLSIEQLLRRICNDSTDGAVLVFLPGWDDINRTREKLLSSPYFKDPSKFLVIALHSMVPLVEQKKVFKRPPPGCRKIVLSTNIAETSVTIDDVVYVIDSGRMKEKSYDPYNNVSTLHSSWISKASAKQREGRAGRCQAGICYHLYSKFRASSLPEFQVPEIKRMPIEELCLQVKLMDPSCKIEEFLQKTLDPPVYETIQNAITVLQDIGALSLEEQLTELGQKLGALPVHPLTSKMLFFAILLNCLDPALTLACASDCKDPFILPMLPNERQKAQVARLELASLYGGNGDQLAIIAAFDCWKMAKQRGDEAKFCSQYFVSAATMKLISSMRKKLEGELLRHGFIPEDASRCSLNARDPGILHAVVFSGLYPMVGRVIPQGNRSLVETASGNKVRLHQFSTNGKLSSKKFSIPPLIMFDEITRGDGGIHIRNCCVVGSLPLMLLATDIVVAPTEEDDDEGDESDADEPDADNDSDEDDKAETHSSSKSNSEKILSAPENVVKVVVDRWLPFQLMALDVAQIYCLRERLSSAILFKVTKPRDVLPEHLGASLYAIACILSYDGMSGISLPPEPVDTLTTMVSVADISHGRRVPIKSYLKSLLYPDHSYPNQSHTSHHHTSHLQKQVSKSATNWSAPQGTSTAKGNYSKRQRGNGNGFR